MKTRTTVLFAANVLLVVVTVYVLNFWLWNYAISKPYVAAIRLKQDSALFLEGLIMVTLGALFILGQGGISLVSLKAAILGAASDATFDRSGAGTPGPSEIFRRDSWKPSGFVRFGLIIVCAGLVLIFLYFV